MKKTLKVLGTVYRVEVRKYKDDPFFAEDQINGYCDANQKLIVLCDMRTHPGWHTAPEETLTAYSRETMRHEIVHAFLNESGLQGSTSILDLPWAANEEMVDWIAIQGPKLAAAWREMGCE